jgi:hypothetical protein
MGRCTVSLTRIGGWIGLWQRARDPAADPQDPPTRGHARGTVEE